MARGHISHGLARAPWWDVPLAALCGAAALGLLIAVPEAAAAVFAGAAIALAVIAAAWALRVRSRAAGAEAEAARQRTLADERAAELARLTDEAAGSGATTAAFQAVAGNVHAMATVQQQVLDGVERRITDPELMAEVMRADHAAAQMIRKARTMLVLCDAPPDDGAGTGAVSLFDCVRGAQSRIVAYSRVEVHGGQQQHAEGAVAEGLMHAVAELLENAAVHSPEDSRVVVTVRDVAAGAVIEIDDAGLGMSTEALEESAALLRDGLDVAELGAAPRLGLACVGRLSRELGFGVELTTASAYGGTRAVVFVPGRLLAEPAAPAPASAGRTSGLPQRQSRRRAEPTADAGAEAGAEAAAVPATGQGHGHGQAKAVRNWSPEAAGASVAGVVAGTRRGRAQAAEQEGAQQGARPDTPEGDQ